MVEVHRCNIFEQVLSFRGVSMILTRNEILEAVHTGGIVIDPFEEEALDAASYDMTLYHQIRVFIEGLNEIDLMEMAQNANILMDITRVVEIPVESYYLLKPGELVLGMTVEKLTLPPNIAGSLEGRSRFARMGLMVHVTASFLQPGLRNTRQVFEICEGMATYTGVFANQREL